MLSRFSVQDLFIGLSSRPGFYYLDSSYGDFSFMGFDPIDTCDYSTLDETLATYAHLIPCEHAHFTGGLVGFLSYDVSDTLPYSWFGVYNKTLVINHKTGEKRLFHYPIAGERTLTDDDVSRLLTHYDPNFKAGNSHRSWSEAAYTQAFNHIHEAIKAGGVYQVNLSERFDTVFTGNPAVFYQRLRTISPAPFAAYLRGDTWSICSASPERFFKKTGRQIITQPIKGTMARGATPDRDHDNRNRLLLSEKNKAELLMITDLLRNDFATVCDSGSVRVTALRALREFSNVFHTESVITGQTDAGITAILAALSPGGSITGAPKRAAMTLIQQLELHPRSIYTGSIGYISFDQYYADFNIAIRTAYTQGNRLYFHGGGGIVFDSNARSEYEEIDSKLSGITQALGNF